VPRQWASASGREMSRGFMRLPLIVVNVSKCNNTPNDGVDNEHWRIKVLKARDSGTGRVARVAARKLRG
jgi:hypothetical protein